MYLYGLLCRDKMHVGCCLFLLAFAFALLINQFCVLYCIPDTEFDNYFIKLCGMMVFMYSVLIVCICDGLTAMRICWRMMEGC